MKRKTKSLINKLSRLLNMPPEMVIEQAVYKMGLTYRLAGVAHDWQELAKERGLSVAIDKDGQAVIEYTKRGVRNA